MRTMRARITATALVIVILILTTTGIASVLIHRTQLRTSVDRGLEQRADRIESDLTDQTHFVGLFADSNAEDRFAQLIDSSGRVIAFSDNLARSGPVVNLDIGRPTYITLDRLSGVEDDSFRVIAVPIENGSNSYVLAVGENVDDLRDAERWLWLTLLFSVPVTAAVLGAVIWWLVGRTLRPVEAIRAQVADIGMTELNRRVPEPETNDEVSRLARTMNEMLDRLERSAGRQQRFVADASHELRSPLTRIRAELEVELARPDGHLRAAGESTLEEINALHLLIEDLLFLARSDSSAPPRRTRSVDLDEVVASEVRYARNQTSVAIDMSRVSGAMVTGDESQLSRLVRNLLDNAVRHANSTVSIVLLEREQLVALRISDDGPGIAPKDRNRVFERFTRLDESRAGDTGGSGLGLAICHEIVRAHGGETRIEASATGGACVVVELPTGSEPTG
jgi:signal transduction histidine kinase